MSIDKKVNNICNQDLLKIKNMIEDSDVKKCWLAIRLNISRQTLDNYLNGDTDIPHRIYISLEVLLTDPNLT